MLKKESLESLHKTTNSSDFSVIDQDKQDVSAFAIASYYHNCFQARDDPNFQKLFELLKSHKGEGLPHNTLCDELKAITPSNSYFSQTDSAYVASCLKRYSYGVPINVEKLAICKRRLVTYERSLKEIIAIGVAKLVDRYRLAIDFNHPLFTNEIYSSWTKSANGRLNVDREELKKLKLPLAQKIYQAKAFLRSKSLLNFKASPEGVHYFYPLPFGAASGRDAPRGNAFIYFPKEIRDYILQARAGYKIYILDYVAQEIGAVAALAGDEELWRAYENGDIYIEMRNRSPLFYTMNRKRFKLLCIAHLYGMTSFGIENNFQIPTQTAKKWYRELRRIFFEVNEYLDVKVSLAIAAGYADVNGYRRSVASFSNKASIRNFFVQATCAQILQTLCLSLDQSKIPIVFAIHDAVACEVPINDNGSYELTEKLMGDASELILGSGYRLKVDCEYSK